MVLGSDREHVRRMGEQARVVPLSRRARIRPKKLDHERHCCSNLVLRRGRSSERRKKKKEQRHRRSSCFFSRPVIEKPHREADGSAHVCADQGGRSCWRGRVGLWPEEPTTWNRGGTTHPTEKAALDPARKTANPTVKVATALDPVVTATKRMRGRLGGSGKQGAAPDLARRRSDVDDR